ncbi:hypothetical protein JCM17846_13860 [Iodidimonas nitroreducens]|uniref:Uncharacterized protein n=1 Tax=Iodidimonas nitroreducens TaxID=1236968 RepID=A0A5A7N7G9_9PROT|nr:hypothetical protein JCM17846_13860 [Iodidimonas nitroreducens]
MWRADADTSLRLSAARGVKMMSLIEFAAVGVGPGPLPGTSFFVTGNPDLGASITEGYDIGVERQLPMLLSSFKANLFYTSLSKNVAVANFAPSFVNPPFFVSQPLMWAHQSRWALNWNSKGKKIICNGV